MKIIFIETNAKEIAELAKELQERQLLEITDFVKFLQARKSTLSE